MLRVVKKYNLLSVILRKKFNYCSKHLHRYQNSLNRNFSANIPNQKCVTNISYIKIVQDFFILQLLDICITIT